MCWIELLDQTNPESHITPRFNFVNQYDHCWVSHCGQFSGFFNMETPSLSPPEQGPWLTPLSGRPCPIEGGAQKGHLSLLSKWTNELFCCYPVLVGTELPPQCLMVYCTKPLSSQFLGLPEWERPGQVTDPLWIFSGSLLRSGSHLPLIWGTNKHQDDQGPLQPQRHL